MKKYPGIRESHLNFPIHKRKKIPILEEDAVLRH